MNQDQTRDRNIRPLDSEARSLWIEKVKGAVLLSEVVGESVSLKKNGSSWVGLCPFHQERTPSLSVNDERGLFHCYGCKEGGDSLHFLMKMFGWSFKEALEDLAHRSGMNLPEGMIRKDPHQEKKNQAHRLNRFVAQYFKQNLKNSEKAKNFLQSRGIDLQVMENFYLGYAEPGWEGLTQFLEKAKAPMLVAKELGLILPSKNKPDQFFDLFRDRVMFPILSSQGKVLGFGGRLLEGDGPKYLNSPESFLYQKSKLLFGVYQARKFIREQRSVFLVEGFIDVLAMVQLGFPNTVASCGTSLTEEHWEQLVRLSEKVVVVFDGDRAGQDAAMKVMELGLKKGKGVYFVPMPEGKDPGDAVRGGDWVEDWKKHLTQPRVLLDEKIKQAMRHARRGPEEKAEVLRVLSRWFEMYQDPQGRQVRVDEVERRLGVKFEGWSPSFGRKTPQLVKKNSVFEEDLKLFQWIWMEGEGAWDRLRREIPARMKLVEVFQSKWARGLMLRLLQSEQVRENLKEFSQDGLKWVSRLKEESYDDPQFRSFSSAWASWNRAEKKEMKEFHFLVQLRSIWARFSQELEEEIRDLAGVRDHDLQMQRTKEHLDVQRKLQEFKRLYDQIQKSPRNEVRS